MSKLWNYFGKKNWKAKTKYQVVSVFLAFAFSLIGLILWLIISPFFLSTLDWMICFIGYPFFAALIFVFFYSCRFEFHDGSHN